MIVTGALDLSSDSVMGKVLICTKGWGGGIFPNSSVCCTPPHSPTSFYSYNCLESLIQPNCCNSSYFISLLPPSLPACLDYLPDSLSLSEQSSSVRQHLPFQARIVSFVSDTSRQGSGFHSTCTPGSCRELQITGNLPSSTLGLQ